MIKKITSILFCFILLSSFINAKDSEENLVKISDNLYVYEDCCNVYLIKNNDEGILIDFGSGKILKLLSKAGIKRIKCVLITHHHRDQIQGLIDIKNKDFEIYIPDGEKQFISGAEKFWENVHIYINYNLRSHFHSVIKNVETSRTVKNGDILNIGNYTIKALLTPGHTDSALSYIANIDGKTVVFSNDLISAPGKVTNYYDLHWGYSGYTSGMNASLKSFEKIKNENPDILLPSHGKPMENPISAIEKLEERFKRLIKMVTPNRQSRTSDEMFSVSKHIVYLGSTSYALVSDRGRAIIYDYGYIDMSRIRAFIKKYNIKNIDAITYSHYHDDHIIRTPELLLRMNSGKKTIETEIWIFEKMLDVFEHPERHTLPCLIPFPIKADRVIKDGETIEWEGFKLYFFHMPGQTTYHQGMMVEDEGKRYVFSGDNNWHPAEGVRPMNSPIIPKNRYFLKDDHGYLKISKDLLDLKTDVIVPSHYFPYSVTRKELEMYRDWAEELTELYRQIIDQPDANMGMDYLWIRFYPYRVEVKPDEEFKINLIVTNHLNHPSEFTITLRYSDNIICNQQTKTYKVPAQSSEMIPFTIKVRPGENTKREIICADITMNEKYLGEYAEMIVDME
ncbi:MBL fold metallo-hydrolase [candidate division KSB1 bacterium]